ncbi:MAG: FtsW/RodA/SpoVE family cell cycle protein [Bacteroides sp.]|nr:FtsW/RodA/SpoVE family cell cycle protein [Bacteroides sp.]
MEKEDGILIKETIDGVAVEDTTQSVASRMRRKRKPDATPTNVQKADPYIWGIYIMLLVISVVELFSASSTEVSSANVYSPLIRHGIFLLLGFGCVIALQRINYMILRKYAWPVAILSLGLLLFSSYFGVEINGAQRAINVAGITIQPAEIVKLTVLVLLATILGRNQEPRGVTTIGVIQVAVVVIAFGACLWRNGLTNTILLMIISISMFLIGNIQWRKLGMIFAIYAICAGVLWIVKYENDKGSDFDRLSATEQIADNSHNIDRTRTQKGRITRFLEGVDPDDPIDDFNRQVIFSKFAQANGGLIGQGPGNSRESARLPLAFSDYIYSIIVEDTGFVGGVVLLVLYLCLLGRAGHLAYRCSRAFPAFLIMGCAVLIVSQALVHMAIVTGLFPVSGQPLPLISKGGTSVIVMSCTIGIMLSVSKYAVTSGDKREIKAELRATPDDMQAANVSGYVKEITQEQGVSLDGTR